MHHENRRNSFTADAGNECSAGSEEKRNLPAAGSGVQSGLFVDRPSDRKRLDGDPVLLPAGTLPSGCFSVDGRKSRNGRWMDPPHDWIAAGLFSGSSDLLGSGASDRRLDAGICSLDREGEKKKQ